MQYEFTTETTSQRHDLLTKWLREDTCTVTFTKVDGTPRVMTCTLQADKLPPSPLTENVRKDNASVLRVYDLDKQEWRSFRLDNVISVSQG